MESEIRNHYLKKLNYFNKEELLLLIKAWNKKIDENKNKEEIKGEIVDNFQDEIKDFFDKYTELQGISINLAKQFLTNKFPDKKDEIENINKKKTVLLFLYKEKKLELFQDLLFECLVGKQKIKVEYILKSEGDPSLENLKVNIEKFVRIWNEKNIWKIRADSNIDKKLNIIIHIEKGRKPLKQFKFRTLNGGYKNLNDLELIKQSIFPVYSKRIEIEKTSKNNYGISYDFDINKERVWFNLLLQNLFGKFNISRKSEKEIKTLRTTMKQTLDKTSSISSVNEELKKRKDKAVVIIDNSRLSPNKKKKLRKIINSINYAGPSFKNDPLTTTRDFTWYAQDFSKTEKVISSTDEFLREIFSKIPQSKENFCLNINSKPVLINKDGEVKQKIRLSDDEQLSLKLFLGGKIND